ncbi:hypothetical protein ACWX0K_16415 [Nitrobacteraceae bacterium UC4446_H13]
MSGQGAILGLLQFRDAERQPNSRDGQAGGKHEGGEIRQHPMSEFVLVAHEATIGWSGGLAGINVRMRRATPHWGGREGAWGEFDHARIVVGLGWHPNFHPVPIPVDRYRLVPAVSLAQGASPAQSKTA